MFCRGQSAGKSTDIDLIALNIEFIKSYFNFFKKSYKIRSWPLNDYTLNTRYILFLI